MLNILIYHKLYANNEKSKNTHAISCSNFKHQMNILQDRNIILAEDYSLYAKEGNKYYAITFDDGKKSDYNIAFNILNEYNLKASFYIITDFINTKNYMSEFEILEMHQKGMKIGSHTCSHSKLSLLDDKAIYEELFQSKKILENIIGDEITSVSVPGGFYNERVIEIAKTMGYKKLFVSDPGLNYSDDFVLKRNTIKKNSDIEKMLDNIFYIKLHEIRYHSLGLIKKYFGNNQYEGIKRIMKKILK